MAFNKKLSCGAALLAALLSTSALADDNDAPHFHSAGNQPFTPSFGETLQEGPSGGIWQQDQLLGTMGGIRPWLGSYGISLGLNETSEFIGQRLFSA